ncbi:hypothetical protein WA158_003132 [Blastocystis sp. Blastoise]
MKLVNSKVIGRDLSGSVTLIPEENEDIWELYNIIAKDDRIKMKTFRKVSNTNSAGTTTINKVPLNLTIQVKKVSYDIESGSMRIGGINVQENEYVSLGAHHTIQIELFKPVTIEKEAWCQIDLNRIKDIVNIEKTAEIGCILMEEGLATLCLIKNKLTFIKAKIEKTIPRKGRGGNTQNEKALEQFFKTIYQNMIKIFNFDTIKVVLLASPGFVRESYLKYMNAQAIREGNRKITQNPSKFLLVHTDSGHMSCLQTVLSDPDIMNKIMDSKNTGELKAINDFYESLSTNPDTVTYGDHHVQKAIELGAVKTFLICDSVLRKTSIQDRQRYSELMETVENMGGSVYILSEMHVSGQQLKNLTGIAAILRYPVPELDELADEDESDDE